MVGVPGQEVWVVPTPEGRMAVEFRGDGTAGPTVVCLHGLSANRTTWRPVADRLPHRSFLLVDLLGRGESDASREARYDLDSEARRLAHVLQTLGLTRPVLAGHSHGAAIAVAAAARVNARGLLLVNPVTPDLSRPAALNALKRPAVRWLVTPALRLFRRSLTRYMLVRRVFADGANIPAGAVDRYAAPWGDRERAACLPTILSDWNPAELERWAAPPEVPVRVISGAEDRRIDPDSARRWATRLGATYTLAAGCGHSAPEERTSDVATVLEDLVIAICAREQEEKQDDQE
jgi:pimeloyl-ACP methyl ester carboxylesterase